MENLAASPTVEHPRGIYPGRVDEKGRVKLPADFQSYLTSIGATKVFVTSLDERTARIYPLAVWKQVEAKLSSAEGEDADAAEDLLFTANDLGGDAELDAQGRILIPPALRRTMGVENQPVHIEFYRAHIRVYSNEVYEARKQRAAEGREQKVRAFERKGLP